MITEKAKVYYEFEITETKSEEDKQQNPVNEIDQKLIGQKTDHATSKDPIATNSRERTAQDELNDYVLSLKIEKLTGSNCQFNL